MSKATKKRRAWWARRFARQTAPLIAQAKRDGRREAQQADDLRGYPCVWVQASTPPQSPDLWAVQIYFDRRELLMHSHDTPEIIARAVSGKALEALAKIGFGVHRIDRWEYAPRTPPAEPNRTA